MPLTKMARTTTESHDPLYLLIGKGSIDDSSTYFQTLHHYQLTYRITVKSRLYFILANNTKGSEFLLVCTYEVEAERHNISEEDAQWGRKMKKGLPGMHKDGEPKTVELIRVVGVDKV